MPKRTEIRVSGLGGQGVVLAGQILGRAAVYDGKKVVQTQSYGAEARGSAAKSEVIISDEKIDFPVVRKCDVLVAMNQTALEKNKKDLKENGILVVEEDMVKVPSDIKVKVFKVPATKTAEAELKSKLYANVVVLGALTRIMGLVSKDAVEKAIVNSVSMEAHEKNINAFRIGFKLINQREPHLCEP
jgi:2-oxoglutarate ferredoxin oxidoreductase subunit gamma